MPTREVDRRWAAVILIVARLVQGFATGGEYGTSATYMSEAATANRRGFFSSFQYVTLVGGHVLAQFTLLIVVSVLDVDADQDWGWRIGFFIGGIAALVVLWMRRTMDESLTEEHLAAIRAGEDTRRRIAQDAVHAVLAAAAAGLPDHRRRHVAFYTYSVNAPAIVKTAFGEDGRRRPPPGSTWSG